MPHFILHYSANLEVLDVASCLSAVAQTLAASGHFQEADVKCRALKVEAFEVGARSDRRGFIAGELRMLDGRGNDLKKALSASVLEAISTRLEPPADIDVQLTIEVVDIHRESYAKSVLSAGVD